MIKILIPFFLLSCQNPVSEKKENMLQKNFVQNSSSDTLQNITSIGIDMTTQAPIAFFYIDPLDEMGTITKNKGHKNAKIEKRILGNDIIVLKYSIQKLVVPFILIPHDSIEIGFTRNLLPIVTFSKFGFEEEYNTFSLMTEKGNTLFSTSNLFISNPKSINIDSFYISDSIKLKSIKVTDSASEQYIKFCKNYLKSQYYLQTVQKTKKIINNEFTQNEENLQFHNFRELLGELEYLKNTSGKKTESDLMVEYFNSALSSTGKIKGYLLYYTMKWMKAKNKNLFEAYKKQFVANCVFQEYIDQIFSTTNIGSASDFYSYKDSTRLNLAQILKNNKGKIIYIDLWASWCAPCRATIPLSKALQIKYNKSPISFVYVSLDENILSWRKAVKEEGIDINTNNFIITNQAKSNFISKFKISAIPRYLLFDKNGQLIQENAPSPENQDLQLLFDKLLLTK